MEHSGAKQLFASNHSSKYLLASVKFILKMHLIFLEMTNPEMTNM